MKNINAKSSEQQLRIVSNDSLDSAITGEELLSRLPPRIKAIYLLHPKFGRSFGAGRFHKA